MKQSNFLIIFLFASLVTGTAMAQTSGSRVDLLYEADTYTPPGYLGRSLPSLGSTVRVAAFTAGSEQGLIFEWKKDGYNLPSVSGKGKNVLEFRAINPRSNGNVIELTVRKPDDSVYAKTSITIPLANPQIVFYPATSDDNGLRQVDYRHPLSALEITADTIVAAEPLFFPKEDWLSHNLRFNWLLGNELIPQDSDDPRFIALLVPNDGSRREGVLELEVKNSNQLSQSASSQLPIRVGSPDFFF